MTETELYQSVLRKLSHIPQSYLEEIDKYLSGLMKKVNPPASNSKKDLIMSFAGSLSDMKEEDFDDYSVATRKLLEHLIL